MEKGTYSKAISERRATAHLDAEAGVDEEIAALEIAVHAAERVQVGHAARRV
jgi:hypothetical protein